MEDWKHVIWSDVRMKAYNYLGIEHKPSCVKIKRERKEIEYYRRWGHITIVRERAVER